MEGAQPDVDGSADAVATAADTVEDVGNNAKAASVRFEEAGEQAWAEVSQFLRAINPHDFQDLVADLLRAMSSHVIWVSPPGKHGGVDILAWPDALGTRPPRIKVQVKRQQQAVSVDGLRSFMALLGDGDVGLFICSGGFTKDAETEACTQEKRRISLIGLEKLFDLWNEHDDKLTERARRRFPLRSIRFLAPGGQVSKATPVAGLQAPLLGDDQLNPRQDGHMRFCLGRRAVAVSASPAEHHGNRPAQHILGSPGGRMGAFPGPIRRELPSENTP